MRVTFRKNHNLTYDQQVQAMQADAIASRAHPNSIANDEAQRQASKEYRDLYEPRLTWGKPARTKSARVPFAHLDPADLLAFIDKGWRVRSRDLHVLSS